MITSRLLRTFQYSKPFMNKLIVGTTATATVGAIAYNVANPEKILTSQIAYCDSSSARSKLTQEELESLRDELKEELIESSEEVKEAVKEAKQEVREAMKEAKNAIDEATEEAGGVDGLVGMIVAGTMGIVAGVVGLVGGILSSVDIDDKVQQGSIIIEISDGDNVETYSSGVEYRKSVAGAETIKYPDGYVYRKSVAGSVEIIGPNGYYYRKSVAGSITERGICNSRFEMGKRY